MNEQDVREFCSLRLPEDSPTHAELAAEFLADPVNSRVGRYCRETERIVRIVTDAELEWDQMLSDWDAAERTLDVPEDTRDNSDASDQLVPSITRLTTHVQPQVDRRSQRRWTMLSACCAMIAVVFIVVNVLVVRHNTSERASLSMALEVIEEQEGIAPRPEPEFVKAAIEVVERRLGREHPAYWRGLEKLLFVLRVKNRYEEAVEVALDLSKRPKLSATDIAERLIDASGLAELQGKHEQGKQLLLRVTELGPTTYCARAFSGLSHMESDAGNPMEAIRYAQEAVEASDDEFTLDKKLHELSTLCYHHEQWALLEKTTARKLAELATHGRMGTPFDYELMALIAHRHNRPVEELQARLNVISVIDAGALPRDVRYAESLGHLAECFSRTGNRTEGRRWIQRSLDEFERLGQTSSAEYAVAMSQAARLSVDRGTSSHSYELALRAIAILEKLPAHKHQRHLTLTYETLCQNQMRSDRLGDAEMSGQRGLALAKQTGDKSMVASLSLELASVALKKEDYDTVVKLAAEAELAAPEFATLHRRSIAGAGMAGQMRWAEALSQLEPALAEALGDDDRGIVRFQVGYVLSNMPGKHQESEALLKESKPVIDRLFPGIAITINGAAIHLVESLAMSVRMTEGQESLFEPQAKRAG
jgi:tetratricopeptide (TPR) repeat protein